MMGQEKNLLTEALKSYLSLTKAPKRLLKQPLWDKKKAYSCKVKLTAGSSTIPSVGQKRLQRTKKVT